MSNNDLISRSELKKALCEFMKNNIGIYSNEMFYLVDSIPTVERPQGDKIKKEHYGWVYCSECDSLLGQQDNFCWHCGAEMKGGNK